MNRDLVLLHGWAMTPRVWEPVIAGLSTLFRVHNLPLPGYDDAPAGVPPSRDGPELLDQWSDDCLRTAPAGAWWMGWSLGAMVVMNAVLRGDGAVGAAVLVSPTPRFINGGDWDAGVEPGLLRGFLEGLKTDDARILKRFALIQAYGSPNPKAEARALAGCLMKGGFDPAVLEAGLAVLEQVDLRSVLAAIDVPVLVVHGAGDRIVPPAAGAHVADRVRRGETATLAAGHAPFVARPGEFVETVRSWM